jgi:hypothetical protein
LNLIIILYLLNFWLIRKLDNVILTK